MNRIAPICFLLCLLSLPALAQTPITGPTIFYKYGSPGAPASADVAGCGTSNTNACETFNFLYAQLVSNYVLKPGGAILIQISGNVHNDTFACQGRMPGQTNPRQIEVVGSMSSPTSFLVSPSSGDAFSAAFDCEYSIGGLMAQNNSGGQGVFTVGQGGRIDLLGQIYSKGAPGQPTIGNDLTAALFGIIELQTPGGPDALGITVTGNYWFQGPGQCAFDAGDQGEIIADGNGQPNIFTFNWNGQTYSAGTGCANNHGVVQIENIHHVGGVSGREYDILTGGTIDAATTGLPHSLPGIFTADPGFTGP